MAEWTPPMTFVSPQVVSDTEWNTHLRDNLLHLRDVKVEKIAEEQIAGDTTSSVTFSNIPNRFQHLEVRVAAQATGEAARVLQFRANGDASENYQRMRSVMVSSGGAWATSDDPANTSGNLGMVGTRRGSCTARLNMAQNTAGFTVVDGLSYFSTGATTGDQAMVVAGGRWLSSSVVTSLTVMLSVPFDTGALITLYGYP